MVSSTLSSRVLTAHTGEVQLTGILRFIPSKWEFMILTIIRATVATSRILPIFFLSPLILNDVQMQRTRYDETRKRSLVVVDCLNSTFGSHHRVQLDGNIFCAFRLMIPISGG